jgi:hypothetical protein
MIRRADRGPGRSDHLRTPSKYADAARLVSSSVKPRKYAGGRCRMNVVMIRYLALFTSASIAV